jgi:hypothetical protein
MATNVRSSDSGSATAGIRVSAARPRNTKITITTRTKASIRVSCTSWTEATMVWERSYTGTMRTAPGSSAMITGTWSRMLWATFTALAPACR